MHHDFIASLLSWVRSGMPRLGSGSGVFALLLGVMAFPCSARAQAPLAGIVQVAAGRFHTCALTTGGGVKCWGLNDYGQLGDGTNTQRLIPVNVSGLTSGVSAIAAGDSHTCALTSAGGVKCWGRNLEGQLGDQTTSGRLTAVNVSGLDSGVSAITTGEQHTCALTIAGGVKCWGANGGGQLGDDTTTQRLMPVDVTGLTVGVSVVAAGGAHTCALTIGGGVKCWGWNFNGQLGDGTTTQRLTPIDVSGLSSGVGAIAVGREHTCAVTAVGGAKCWGVNWSGQLGDGTTNGHLTPVDVSGLSSGVSAIAASELHTCALTSGGGVRCWGRNDFGQIGDGIATITHLTPADVSGLSIGASAIATGGSHTCALTTVGGAKCWGRNLEGQLGDGIYPFRVTATDVGGLSSAVSAISTDTAHTCALTTGGGVQCWGRNFDGQLGDGTTTQRLTPVDVVGLNSGVGAVNPGNGHTCALTTVGGVKCWGRNLDGQLGDGTTTQRLTPVDVSGLSSGVAAITAGNRHTCAITTGGGVKCWGRNLDGQLGDGTTTILRLTPVDVSGLSSGVRAIVAGGFFSCALTDVGGVKCWGDNSFGQLGDGTTTRRSTAVDVSGLSSGVSAIAARGSHTCALTIVGAVQCWGDNREGQLGDGTTVRRLTPVNVSGLSSGVSAITLGGSHTCALTTGGELKCWGQNSFGQLGDGTTIRSLSPVDVGGLTSGISAITAGGAHTCVLTSGGVQCWGSHLSGQLGIGGRNYGLPGDVLTSGLIFLNGFENAP